MRLFLNNLDSLFQLTQFKLDFAQPDQFWPINRGWRASKLLNSFLDLLLHLVVPLCHNMTYPFIAFVQLSFEAVEVIRRLGWRFLNSRQLRSGGFSCRRYRCES